ncbi:hypothetical protein POVCU2_0011110 [Plasmodium ovale curtisi]|uniref:Uncharacterized protein n=1 Tax=Plasmodium ovale curtisi TaxID=864141 RepID=A0A1A8VMQ9_PLAOA|nr:hypothetical protein POVCU2_0011110 [Plasmodium ovale curtisi]
MTSLENDVSPKREGSNSSSSNSDSSSAKEGGHPQWVDSRQVNRVTAIPPMENYQFERPVIKNTEGNDHPYTFRTKSGHYFAKEKEHTKSVQCSFKKKKKKKKSVRMELIYHPNFPKKKKKKKIKQSNDAYIETHTIAKDGWIDGDGGLGNSVF